MSPPDSAIEKVKAVISGRFVRIGVGERPQEMLNSEVNLNLGWERAGAYLKIIEPVPF